MVRERERAVLFIDGNNWYHSLRSVGAAEPGRLDYARISRKLVQHREWIATRYYLGRVDQRSAPKLYSDQRRFLARMTRADRRISAHLGRLEPRRESNRAATELRDYLRALRVKIPRHVYRDLVAIAKRHHQAEVYVEKAVDVMLAVDMVVMAERDAFDVAYLLSADGDFTPAVEAVRAHGKGVYAVAGRHGARLREGVNAFLRVDATWLGDCYRGD